MVPPPPPSSSSSSAATTCSKQEQQGASPLFYLARFAMALAPSSLVMIGAGTLTPALFAPIEAVHAAGGADGAGTDADFKVRF